MLVITRRTGETVNIGDDIEVTILSIKGNQVRIGIQAPQDVGVYREEIYNRIQNESDSQASSSVSKNKELSASEII